MKNLIFLMNKFDEFSGQRETAQNEIFLARLAYRQQLLRLRGKKNAIKELDDKVSKILKSLGIFIKENKLDDFGLSLVINNNLAEIVGKHTTLKHGLYGLVGKCPCCSMHDITVLNNKWRCLLCMYEWGDAFDFLMMLEDKTPEQVIAEERSRL